MFLHQNEIGCRNLKPPEKNIKSPAGTGKIESVKALGQQMGRFVLVFNCNETFDFQAMGRIFVGLCQVGTWGCFDEFNRLEERMLSAVSQQVQTIQEALKSQTDCKRRF
ncbi:dynein heavy chain, cytoplasmic-like [Lycorma delicatula]|uniref:dynein heavy chain, cytoplasmic-like n=1 Tax=Lycorma delicatula TaxID=130591 RepID=UPI003F518109